MPCTPNTSSESSAFEPFFHLRHPLKHTTPATAPTRTALRKPTKPAGVMATSPATQPEHRSSRRCGPAPTIRHAPGQRTAGSGDVRHQHGCSPARLSAASADPALNPNQPTTQAGARHRQAQVEGVTLRVRSPAQPRGGQTRAAAPALM